MISCVNNNFPMRMAPPTNVCERCCLLVPSLVTFTPFTYLNPLFFLIFLFVSRWYSPPSATQVSPPLSYLNPLFFFFNLPFCITLILFVSHCFLLFFVLVTDMILGVCVCVCLCVCVCVCVCLSVFLSFTWHRVYLLTLRSQFLCK